MASQTSAGPSTPPTSPIPTTAVTTPLATTPPASTPATTAPAESGEPAPAESSTGSPTELPSIPVVVLNSTTEPGLAGRVSDYLAGQGWLTGEPGNFTEATPTTTVYFPVGYDDVARSLAAVAPGSGTSVAPTTPELQADVLTVVLGEDAVGWTPPTQGTPT